MPFVTAGDPDLDFTAAVIRELAARGSNLCELGIPYSDPDRRRAGDSGVVHPGAGQEDQAGRHSGNVGKITPDADLRPSSRWSATAIVFRHGLEKYVADAKAAGVAGAIVPDLPVEEAGPLAEICRREDFSLDPTHHAHHAARPGVEDRRANHGLHLLRLGDRHHRRAHRAAAVDCRQRRLAARANAAADLHRFRHQPARARADARAGGRRPDRRLGHRPPHGRSRPKTAPRSAQRNRRLRGRTDSGDEVIGSNLQSQFYKKVCSKRFKFSLHCLFQMPQVQFCICLVDKMPAIILNFVQRIAKVTSWRMNTHLFQIRVINIHTPVLRS